jgi:hypothetical protein
MTKKWKSPEVFLQISFRGKRDKIAGNQLAITQTITGENQLMTRHAKGLVAIRYQLPAAITLTELQERTERTNTSYLDRVGGDIVLVLSYQ